MHNVIFYMSSLLETDVEEDHGVVISNNGQEYPLQLVFNVQKTEASGEHWQGRFYGEGRGPPPMKNVAPQCPPPILAQPPYRLSLKNRPVISLIQLQNTVISLIQLHIVAPRTPIWNCAPIGTPSG